MWREAIRDAMDARSWDARKITKIGLENLAHARCFDLREVQPLCYEVSKELEAASDDAPSLYFDGMAALRIDLGEHVCVPAPSTWIEYNNLSACITVGDQFANAPPAPFFEEGPGPSTYTMSFLAEYRGVEFPWREMVKRMVLFRIEDGIAQIVRLAKDAANMGHGTRQFACMALAGLAVINSRAACMEAIEPHRGFVRNARQRGVTLNSGIVHTKVTLGRGHSNEGGERRESHPKAYHFCRAHTRLKNSKIERVRAHWRGDPAFGYRLPSYSVKAPAALIDGDAA